MSRTITATDKFADLPIGAVIRDSYGNVYQRVETYGTAHRGWLPIGSELDVHHKDFELPAIVLYDPREAE